MAVVPNSGSLSRITNTSCARTRALNIRVVYLRNTRGRGEEWVRERNGRAIETAGTFHAWARVGELVFVGA